MDRITAAKKEQEQNETKDKDKPDDPTKGENQKESKADPVKEEKNQGIFLLDATCTPAEIAYPTGLTLLDEAIEILEDINTLHAPHIGTHNKSRTYREKARKANLQVTNNGGLA